MLINIYTTERVYVSRKQLLKMQMFVDKVHVIIAFQLRIDAYVRAHIEYKRTDVGLEIPRSALALLGKFSTNADHR